MWAGYNDVILLVILVYFLMLLLSMCSLCLDGCCGGACFMIACVCMCAGYFDTGACVVDLLNCLLVCFSRWWAYIWFYNRFGVGWVCVVRVLRVWISLIVCGLLCCRAFTS